MIDWTDVAKTLGIDTLGREFANEHYIWLIYPVAGCTSLDAPDHIPIYCEACVRQLALWHCYESPTLSLQ